jgi:hypothetical protein
MASVTNLGEHSQDGRHWGVEQTLVDALEEVRRGERKGSKVIVLFLDDGENKFDFGFRQGGMKASQIIALLEYAKAHFIHEMSVWQT